jgi:hypothetical protein
MKISVEWIAEKPTAEEVADMMSKSCAGGLLAVTPNTFKANILGNDSVCYRVDFECVSLKCFSNVPINDRSLPRNNGLFVGNQILKWLYRNYQVHGKILVEGISVGDYAARLEEAMRQAVEDLKRTRSWFKDRRLAEIRRRLEIALVSKC